MFTLNIEFAYILLTLPLLVLWLVFYAVNKKTRREQLLMSLLATPLGPLSELAYFQDYWLPISSIPITLGPIAFMGEDLLFAFSIGGIAAVAYEILLRKRLKKTDRVKPIIKWPFILCSVFGVSIILFVFGVNSIFATSIGAIIGALFILVDRKDLFEDSFISGVLVMLTMFVLYIIEFMFLENREDIIKAVWLLHGTNFDIRVIGVPLTELVWGFSWGAFAGPLYEFWRNYKIT